MKCWHDYLFEAYPLNWDVKPAKSGNKAVLFVLGGSLVIDNQGQLSIPGLKRDSGICAGVSLSDHFHCLPCHLKLSPPWSGTAGTLACLPGSSEPCRQQSPCYYAFHIPWRKNRIPRNGVLRVSCVWLLEQKCSLWSLFISWILWFLWKFKWAAKWMWKRLPHWLPPEEIQLHHTEDKSKPRLSLEA